MYTRFASLLPIAALAAVVAGAPSALEARNGGTSECHTGTLQCCNSISTMSSSLITMLRLTVTAITLQASNPITSILLQIFGANAGQITGSVGLTCSGNVASSTSCTQEPVCCNGNTFNGGLVVIGCSPITL